MAAGMGGVLITATGPSRRLYSRVFPTLKHDLTPRPLKPMSEKLDQQSTRAEGDAVRSANLSQAERESNDAKVSTFSVRFQGGDDVDIGSGMLSVMEVPSSTSGLLAKSGCFVRSFLRRILTCSRIAMAGDS